MVILVHCIVNSYSVLDYDSITPSDTLQKKDGILRQLLQIGIPLFFYISGMSATFFDTQNKGFGNFALEKFVRLIAPLFLAIPCFLIPRLYLGQEFEDWTRIQPDQVEKNFWAYFVKVIPTLPWKMSWLWFLPLLFTVSIFSYPGLKWTQRRAKRVEIDFKEDGKILFAQFLVFLKLSIVGVYYCTQGN
jgi:surface polysaccharide O-acyltransferase-like enzyme